MSGFNCPSCSSEQTQRLSAIVDSGTSHTRGRTVTGFSGVGGGAGGFGGFGGVSSGVTNAVTKSSLARKLSAPVRKPEVQLYMLGIATFLLGFITFRVSFLLALLMLCGGGALAYRGYLNGVWNRGQFPRLLRTWQETFYCHRCENVYTPAGMAYGSPSGPTIDGGNQGAPISAGSDRNQLR